MRGKNLQFIGELLGALQIDYSEANPDFAKIKRAFTPEVVIRVHEVLLELWPDSDDYDRCASEEREQVTALYTGNYEPASVLRAITRLSLYCDKIYLVDPFMRADRIRDQFNPLLHPAEHRATTVQYSFLWLALVPWIHAGIVEFIRPLHDFVPGLWHEVIEIERRRFDQNPELKRALDDEVKQQMRDVSPLDRGFGEIYILSHPDEALRELFRTFSEEGDNNPFGSEDEFVAYVQRRRDQHPYYVDPLPGQHGEFYHQTSGACYELAKRMCSLFNSHIVTDLKSRWKEVEFDRQNSRIDLQEWSPFAKALQESSLTMLNDVPLRAALTLREEHRLESLRLFLRKVWKTCRDPDDFSDTNAINLSAELRDEVAKAKEEWSKIDRDLLKWLGGSGAALISAGAVGFVPAAAASAIAGVTGLIQSRIRRTTFKERFPAGFFLGLR